MNHLLTITQHETLGVTSPSDSEPNRERRASRAVLLDSMGAIALVHFRRTGQHKLPGGGIDEGETELEALKREVREETGCAIDPSSLRDLGIITERRDYCGMMSISYCWTGHVLGDKGAVDPTPGELKDGMEVIWAPTMEEAVRLIQSSPNDADPIGCEFLRYRDVQILKAAEQALY